MIFACYFMLVAVFSATLSFTYPTNQNGWYTDTKDMDVYVNRAADNLYGDPVYTNADENVSSDKLTGKVEPFTTFCRMDRRRRSVGKFIYKGINKGAAFVKGLAVRKMLLKDAISIKSTSKRFKMFKKSGGFGRALKDFKRTGLTVTRIHKQTDEVYKGYEATVDISNTDILK